MLKDLIKSNQDYNKIIESYNSKYIQDRIISNLYLPKLNLLKKTKYNFIALDYIEEQFSDLRADVIKFIDKGIMPDYPELYGILNPTDVYSSIFSDKFSKNIKIDPKNIRSNSDYINLLRTDVTEIVDTKTEASSGLLLSIEPPSPMSREEFASSDFFKNYLLKLVEQYGFIIDKNIPWILKSNMQSPYVKKNYPTSIKSNYFEIKYHQIFEFYKNILQYESDSIILSMSNPYEFTSYCEEQQKFVIKSNFITNVALSDNDIIDFIVHILGKQNNLNTHNISFVKEAVSKTEGLDTGQKLWYAQNMITALQQDQKL